MNNSKRIEKIVSNNNILIENVRLELATNIKELENSLNNYLSLLKLFVEDDKKINKYNKICKQLNDLACGINNSNDLNKIIEQRNKFNYYFNRLKKELLQKDFKVNLLQEKTNNYRKSVAKYIRYIKRQENIDKIKKLNSNYKALSDDEKNLLKRLIKNENNYNYRNLKRINNNNIYNKKNTISSNDIGKIIENFEKDRSNSEEKKDLQIKNLFINNQKIVNICSYDVIKSIEEKVIIYDNKYKLNSLRCYYNSGFFLNSCVLVKNIPSYLKNKKIIKKMKEENVSNERELNGFIEYNRRRNSIKLALKEIFNQKYRNSTLALYLRDNKYCSIWLRKHNYYSNKTLSK